MSLYFLVDNNVLNRLPRPVLAFPAFVERCRLPAEVVFEARAADYVERIRRLEVPVTINILNQVKLVMSSVEPSDRNFVDLFHNQGGADPLLIATALSLNGSQDGLWEDVWAVASEDDAVRAAAKVFGVDPYTTDELISALGYQR